MEQKQPNIDFIKAYEEHVSIVKKMESTILESHLTIQKLQLDIIKLRKMLFGSSHEKYVAAVDPNAPTLFDLPAIAEAVTTSTTTVVYEKTKKQLRPNHPGRNPFPEHLRREEQIINPEGIDLATSKKIGEDITEMLAYKPSELYVKRIIRNKFVDTLSNKVCQANAPSRSFERSNMDPSLIAQIIVEKMVDHLPLDRQIKRYTRLGVTISDSTIGNVLVTAATLLTPLFNKHKEMVLGDHYLNVDETHISVLDSNKKGASHQGYFWVYYSNKQKLVFFDYQPGRGKDGPRGILKNYKGYLQTDGYGVYDEFDKNPDITLINCMAHARRKFHEALPNDKVRAEYVLGEIQKLYHIESYLKENNSIGIEKRDYRVKHAVPILKALGLWMQEHYAAVIPSSAIAKAIFYSLHRWEKLSVYATTDFLNIDNNPVENIIRPVAIGRKNYLFAGNHEAAERLGMFYSLLSTCKIYSINPVVWLEDILTRIADHPVNRIEELLPQNWKQLQVK